MIRAISYIRYSTPKQALGDSLRRQLDRTRAYCAKHSLTLDESLRDEGLSGYKGDHVKHGALGRFLARVKSGDVPHGTYLILEHLDRFSRQNTRIALTMLLNLINDGIRVVTLFNEQVYSDISPTIEHDLIGAILYMSEAHKASVRKSDLGRETWAGNRQAVASGARKRLTGMRPAWLDVDSDGGFVANTFGAATIQRIFELMAGGMSTYAVCQLLNDKRHPTPPLTGKKLDKHGNSRANGWSTSRVGNLIKSDAPLGWFQPHRKDGTKRIPVGDPIANYFPVIVSQALADRARHQLASRQFGGFGSGRTGACVTNLFGGLVRCAVCAGSMYLMHHGSIGGRGQPRRTHPGYLRCSRNKRNMACPNDGTIPYDPFERMVVGLIGDFSVPDGDAAGGDLATDTLIERLAQARADATRTYNRFTTLSNAFADATPAPLMTRRLTELEAQHATQVAGIKDLETQVEAERRKPNPTDEIEAVQRILSDVWAADFDVRLLARTRVAAGMKRFITEFLCFPNRGVIAKYRLGTQDAARVVIRIWLTPDGQYEPYKMEWEWGVRKGKPLLTAPIDGWRQRILDYDPSYDCDFKQSAKWRGLESPTNT